MLQQRLTIITLGVQDLKTATRFYENAFGWQKLPSSNDDITLFQLNGMLLSLYPTGKLAEDAEVASESAGFKGFSLAYNTRSEAEVDTIIAGLESKGVHIAKRPQKAFWGGYSSYIADPDGHLWEIAFNPYLPMDKAGNALMEL